MFRIALITLAVIIAGLAVSSAMLLTAAAHDKPLHRAYACAFARDLGAERHLPAVPCHP